MIIAGDHHHRCLVGNPKMQCFARPGSALCKDEVSARQEFIDIGKELFFGGQSVDFFDAPPVPNIFKGFCSVCDWIASDMQYFGFETRELPPCDYLEFRMPLALSALQECGLLHEKPKAFGMSGLFPEYQPRGVQKTEVPFEQNGLYIIEAPTGCGKTEEALAIASSLIQRGYADSVLFALPTQATANSMFERLEAVADKMYPNGANIVLAHGKSRFNKGLLALCARAAGSRSDEGLQQCSAWLATSKKRAFFGQIGVCTIDQVLMGALPIRHNFVRTFATGRSVLIVDEVHAYDSYMNGLLDKVLCEQRACGSSAVLLSATLPSARKKEIIDMWYKSSDFAPSKEYPLISVVTPESCQEFIPDDKPKVSSIHLEIVRSKDVMPDDELLARIIKYAENGFNIAIICNIVADAQLIWRKLKK